MTDSPEITVAADEPLTEAAIEAWARVLLDIADREAVEVPR